MQWRGGIPAGGHPSPDDHASPDNLHLFPSQAVERGHGAIPDDCTSTTSQEENITARNPGYVHIIKDGTQPKTKTLA
jgi:hypothetical protein